MQLVLYNVLSCLRLCKLKVVFTMQLLAYIYAYVQIIRYFKNSKDLMLSSLNFAFIFVVVLPQPSQSTVFHWDFVFI
jgi:hypothetical protein